MNEFKKPKPLFTRTNPVDLFFIFKIYWLTVSKNQCDIWYPHYLWFLLNFLFQYFLGSHSLLNKYAIPSKVSAFSLNNHHHCHIIIIITVASLAIIILVASFHWYSTPRQPNLHFHCNWGRRRHCSLFLSLPQLDYELPLPAPPYHVSTNRLIAFYKSVFVTSPFLNRFF